MDDVDNQRENRDFAEVLSVEIVDNPVDTVDEYGLWLCINRN